MLSATHTRPDSPVYVYAHVRTCKHVHHQNTSACSRASYSLCVDAYVRIFAKYFKIFTLVSMCTIKTHQRAHVHHTHYMWMHMYAYLFLLQINIFTSKYISVLTCIILTMCGCICTHIYEIFQNIYEIFQNTSACSRASYSLYVDAYVRIFTHVFMCNIHI
jgi:hypothetical protein